MAASVLGVVVLAAAGPADHDLVLVDRDLDRAVTGPVLGVDRVVLHGRVEPQPVALLAVVERAFERARAGRPAARASAAPARTLGLGLVALLGFRRLGLFLLGG